MERDGGDKHRRLVLAPGLEAQRVADHRKSRHRPDCDQRRHHEAEPDLHHQRVEAVRGEHVKGGVRDVDDARDAENQRKADRQQRVHAAVDQPRYEDVLENLETYCFGILKGCMPFTCGGQNGTFFPSCHCTAMPAVLPTAHTRSWRLSQVSVPAVPTCSIFSITGTSLSASVLPACSIAALRIMIAS